MFKDWAVGQFDLKDGESDDEEDVSAQIPKARDIFFKKNKKDIYILPPMSNFKTVREKQRVVRGYIGAVYRKSNQSMGSFFSELDNRGLCWKQNITISLHSGIEG